MDGFVTSCASLAACFATAAGDAADAASSSGLVGVWLAAVLLVLGLLFVVGDVFIPTGGALTIIGLFGTVASIVLAFDDGPTTGLGFLLATMIALPILLAVAVKFFPHTPLGRAIILRRATRPEKRSRPAPEHPVCVGQRGMTVTPLRPGGTAQINSEQIDVVTEGDLVDAGVEVEVLAIAGNRVVVRAIS